ncbi:MAG: DUF3419 family protein [Bacteroidota bacterium]
MRSFLETLNYSSSNEDSGSEIKALEISEADSVVCITGSGARTLDLLIEKPKTIVSVDFNRCQNFLLELKMAGIKHLQYQDFLEFVGVLPSSRRRSMYKDIRQSLSARGRDFWDRHSTIIEEGVIYQGRWEKYFRPLARLVSLVRPGLVAELFGCVNLSAQTRVWREQCDRVPWRALLRSVSLKAFWKYLLGDPGFYQHVPCNFSVYEYLNERLASAFENTLASESSFATLLFLGKYNPNGALPSHLQKKHYGTLQNSLCRVQIVTCSLAQYLERCAKKQFDKYSVSDVASYTDAEEYESIWKRIIATASPGARICERQFLVKREIPADVEPCVRRNHELELELARTDTSIFYTFVVGEVKGKENV